MWRRLVLLRLSSTRAAVEASPAVGMEDERVQALLQRMTGVDFNRVYATRKEELTLPRYRLLSEKQLREVQPHVLLMQATSGCIFCCTGTPGSN